MTTLYEIVVRGELGPTVSCAFEGMRVDVRAGETAIVGDVVDQAHLAGILRRIVDLGLDLVSVTQLQAENVGRSPDGHATLSHP